MNYRSVQILIVIGCTVTITSCGSKVKQLEEQLQTKEEQVSQLKTQLDHLRGTNSSLLDRLSDLSVITQTDAKSIQNSLESMNRQNDYIQNLTHKIHEKDSINLTLVTNLKRSLLDFDDEDIQVQVKGSAVYVSIADKMLFRSGSTSLSKEAGAVLMKVASIINDHDDINVLVEGHTDDIPIANEKVNDNWDLSVLRATAVVRELQHRHQVNPDRLTAAGRSEYIPKGDNQTKEGQSQNRRTEIIITPKLDQFFKLLKAPELLG